MKNFLILFTIFLLCACEKLEKKEKDDSAFYWLGVTRNEREKLSECSDEYWRTDFKETTGSYLILSDDRGEKNLGCVGVYLLDKYSRIFIANGEKITTNSISLTNPKTALQCRLKDLSGIFLDTAWYKQDRLDIRKAKFVFEHSIQKTDDSKEITSMDSFLNYIAGDILYCCHSFQPFICYRLQIQ